MLAHGRLQGAVVDDHLGRGDAGRARWLAGATAARLPTSHLLRTGTIKNTQPMNFSLFLITTLS